MFPLLGSSFADGMRDRASAKSVHLSLYKSITRYTVPLYHHLLDQKFIATTYDNNPGKDAPQ
jgi:hypothetical protein